MVNCSNYSNFCIMRISSLRTGHIFPHSWSLNKLYFWIIAYETNAIKQNFTFCVIWLICKILASHYFDDHFSSTHYRTALHKKYIGFIFRKLSNNQMFFEMHWKYKYIYFFLNVFFIHIHSFEFSNRHMPKSFKQHIKFIFRKVKEMKIRKHLKCYLFLTLVCKKKTNLCLYFSKSHFDYNIENILSLFLQYKEYCLLYLFYFLCFTIIQNTFKMYSLLYIIFIYFKFYLLF